MTIDEFLEAGFLEYELPAMRGGLRLHRCGVRLKQASSECCIIRFAGLQVAQMPDPPGRRRIGRQAW